VDRVRRDPAAVATPPVLMAFDLLYQDGREFTGRPLHERRARLEEAVAGSDFVLPVRRLAQNGFEAWSEVVAHDYEAWSPRTRPVCTRRDRPGAGSRSSRRAGPSRRTSGRGVSALAPSGAARLAIRSPAVSLLADLDAFFQEHERCGELDSRRGRPGSG
jgi:hypothetical protein